MTTASAALKNAALRLAEMGYPVFPCVPGGKEPATKNGLLDATTDTEKVETWWDWRPDYNVAVRTDGLLVIDIDGADNPWMKDDPERLMDLLSGSMSVTPRGGSHTYFRQPSAGAAAPYRNTAGKLAEHVDTRADGGYVLVPPSRLSSGGIYQWAPFLELDCGPKQLGEPPGWVLAGLSASPPAPRLLPVVGEADSMIPQGKRNDALARLGGTVRRTGAGEHEVYALLAATNSRRCDPPLEDYEVRAVARSICRYEPDQVTQAVTEGWWEDGSDSPTAAEDQRRRTAPKAVGAFPEGLLHVPGLISEIMTWNLNGGFRHQPVLALAGAIALMGTITGRKVRDSRGTRTNIYVLGVGPSGCGKERSRQVNKEILAAAGMDDMIGPEGIGSHAGLVSAVDKNPVVLFQLDEIGRFVKTLNSPEKSPHLYQVVTVLMKLYSSAGGLYVGDAYADLAKVKRIDQPHACLYGTTVPQSLYEGLSAESLTDGFLGRLLIFEAGKVEADRHPDGSSVPERILNAVGFWRDLNPGGNLGTRQVVAETSDDANEVFAAFSATAEALSDGGDLGPLWTRAGEKARKMALIHACSAHGIMPRVDLAAAEWGCALADYLTRKIAELSVDWLAENRFHRESNRVFRIIKTHPLGVSASELVYRTRGMTSREREESLRSLIESGLVRKDFERTGGRPRTVYLSNETTTEQVHSKEA